MCRLQNTRQKYIPENYDIGEMMKQLNTRIPLIGLFLLLAAISLLLTVYSAKVYKSIEDNNDKNNAASTAAIYVIEKIRQNNITGNISIKNNQIIMKTDDDINTVIYLYAGKLYEINLYADMQLTPGSGEPLFDIKKMIITKNKKIVSISVTDFDNHTVTRKLIIYEK